MYGYMALLFDLMNIKNNMHKLSVMAISATLKIPDSNGPIIINMKSKTEPW